MHKPLHIEVRTKASLRLSLSLSLSLANESTTVTVETVSLIADLGACGAACVGRNALRVWVQQGQDHDPEELDRESEARRTERLQRGNAQARGQR
eukprot:3034467-Rhodomonas_salina.1